MVVSLLLPLGWLELCRDKWGVRALQMHVAHEPESMIRIVDLKEKRASLQREKDTFKGHNKVLKTSIYLTYSK